MSAQEFAFTVQLSPGSTIDSANGILRGVTVAEIGTATGHFAFLDTAGKVVCVGGADDGPLNIVTKRVPLCMDAKSIESVINAGKMAQRVKAREDHDDSVGARAGFVENFRADGQKAICDVTVFESYRNRGVFLETAAQTPELIGLSGDFKFTAEIKDGCAMMRVSKVDAVDIVDQGALTHAGLFKAKVIDTTIIPNAEPFSIMAKTIEPPDMKAFKTMCDAVAAYKAQTADSSAAIDECMSSLMPKPVVAPVTAAVAAAAKPEVTESMNAAELSALKADLTKELTASFATLADTAAAKAVSAAQVDFQKQMSALGLKPGAAPAATVAGAVVATPPLEASKDFLVLKAAVAKERKISATEATRAVMAEHPEVYEAYQIKLGIIKPKAA